MRTLPLVLVCLVARCGDVAFGADGPGAGKEGAGRQSVGTPAELRSVMAAFGVGDITDAATVESSGSGFIVHPDGYILSNNHVVNGADKIDVVLHDGTIHPAKVIETDAYKDLALIKIDSKGLTAAPLGESDKLEIMDTVMAIGYPLSFIIGSASAAASEGRLNARRDDNIEMLQIDANVNPGNSGGPLVNERGEVIGVIVSKLNSTRFLKVEGDKVTGSLPERVNYAIPLREARGLLKVPYPYGVPVPKGRTKLEPKAIFKEMKPATVLILNHGGAKPHGVAGGGGGNGGSAGQGFVFDLPGLPNGAKKLAMVAVPGRGNVKPFFMGTYEVTQGQYEALMDKNLSTHKNGPDYPVETVSWDEAKGFCRRLSAGLPDKLKGKFVFRLPTDAEWSIAVGLPEESGSTSGEKSGKIKDVYPWGTQWPPPSGAGNYCDESTKGKHGGLIAGFDDGYSETSPIGSFKPNQYGLYDLGGNVWEWCEDFYDGKSGGRVLRGASWYNDDQDSLLSSYRGSGAPGSRDDSYGFRCVLGVGESSP